MSTSTFSRARELAEQALDLPAEQRRGFLEEACGSEPELRETAFELAGVTLADSSRSPLDPPPAPDQP